MKTTTYSDQNEWLTARNGRITGSTLKDLIVKRGTGKKIGFYELIASRIATPADGEDPMERGHRLEEEAIERFQTETGLKDVCTDLVIWERDDNPNIAISPDGFIGETIACEIKCLSSSRHIEAYLTKSYKEYEAQTIQYFVVSEKLETLYLCFYDPRLVAKDFFYFTIKREEVQAQIDEMLELERLTLEEVNKIVLELTEF